MVKICFFLNTYENLVFYHVNTGPKIQFKVSKRVQCAPFSYDAISSSNGGESVLEVKLQASTKEKRLMS
jgi:hypothetical protein